VGAEEEARADRKGYAQQR